MIFKPKASKRLKPLLSSPRGAERHGVEAKDLRRQEAEEAGAVILQAPWPCILEPLTVQQFGDELGLLGLSHGLKV